MKTTYYYLAGLLLLVLVLGIWFFAMIGQNNGPEPSPTTDTVNGQSGALSQMSFFITSANPGKGADLGGLAGADNYCQTLADAANAGNRTWRAYLSVAAAENSPAVNARDRIGSGPWKNFQGTVIAANLDELHGDNNINKQTALTENGEVVSGRGDEVNRHDILTGSTPDGRAIASSSDTTCGNWTSDSAGAAMLGHHDRLGTSDTDAARSWNSSHYSRGCGLDALATTGSAGLLYCFAI